MQRQDYRKQIRDYIRAEAQPPDKFSHQERLYRLAVEIGRTMAYDDDVVYAGAWLHDLGVFLGHRPSDLAALSNWDNVAYAMNQAPGLLESWGFPSGKIAAVVEVIRTHQPSSQPTCVEGTILRDADILEQLGAMAILRTVSKVGRDTRFASFADAVRVLRRNLEQLPGALKLERARELAQPRSEALRAFLKAVEIEAGNPEAL